MRKLLTRLVGMNLTRARSEGSVLQHLCRAECPGQMLDPDEDVWRCGRAGGVNDGRSLGRRLPLMPVAERVPGTAPRELAAASIICGALQGDPERNAEGQLDIGNPSTTHRWWLGLRSPHALGLHGVIAFTRRNVYETVNTDRLTVESGKRSIRSRSGLAS
jgi:hypothetical protein